MHSKDKIMRPKFFFLVLVESLVQALLACADSATTTAAVTAVTAEAARPDEIVQHFYQAMNDSDIESALTFIADDIECRGHCYITGKNSFQTFIQNNINHNDQFEI